MSRDFKKTVALVLDGVECSIPAGYQLSGEDYQAICEIMKEGKEYRAISAAFAYGYVLGHRATKKGAYEELRKGRRNGGK